MKKYKCNHCEVKLYKYAVNAISKRNTISQLYCGLNQNGKSEMKKYKCNYYAVNAISKLME